MTREYLASYRVKTPDPLLNHPPLGQRLVISWSIPIRCMEMDNLHIDVQIRYRNRDEEQFQIPIDKSCGTYIHSVLDSDYFTRCGILTYKVDLVGDGKIIEEWRHQIWSDRIELSSLEEMENEEESWELDDDLDPKSSDQ